MTLEEIRPITEKERYDIDDLCNIFAYLRSENGCPWDREQTHESIRSNLIEETYEVIEAIDKADAKLMREELGDLLLQVIFHSYMEKEQGRFDFEDVVSDIAAKLVFRHPHVFGDVSANGADGALDAWEAAKKKEKTERKTTSDVLRAVPPALPALMRAEKVMKKSRKAGLDTTKIANGVTDAAERIKRALDGDALGDARDDMAELLLSAAAAASLLGIDAEELLAKKTDRYIEECDD